MSAPPQPLFGSARSFTHYDRSGYPAAEALAIKYLSSVEPALAPIAAHEHAVSFLRIRSQHPESFHHYQTSLERLLLWSFFVKRKSVFELDMHDASAFIDFIKDPPWEWMGGPSVPRFIHIHHSDGITDTIVNPEWRPFDFGRLPGIKTCRRIVRSCTVFYNHLCKGGILNKNPFAEFRCFIEKTEQSRQRMSTEIVSKDQWRQILTAARDMAQCSPVRHERTLFLIALMSYANITVLDLIADNGKILPMASFFHSEHHWLLRTECAEIALSNSFIEVFLRRYCAHRNLDLSALGSEPIIPRQRGTGELTRRSLIKIIKKAFAFTLQTLRGYNCSEHEYREMEISCKQWIYTNQSHCEHACLMAGTERNLAPQPLFADFSHIFKLQEEASHCYKSTQAFLASCSNGSAPFELYKWTKAFLDRAQNKNTYDIYRKYIERFALWLMLVKIKPLTLLDASDVDEFYKFCASPPLSWVRNHMGRRFLKDSAKTHNCLAEAYKFNSQWRPFWFKGDAANPDATIYISGHHTLAGQHTSCNVFFEFLLAQGVIAKHPIKFTNAFNNFSHLKSSNNKGEIEWSLGSASDFVRACTEVFQGWQKSRILFLCYTINELNLTSSDIDNYSARFRFDCFSQFPDGAWIATLQDKAGVTKTLKVTSRYIHNVLLVYKGILGREHVPSNQDEYAVFATIYGRPGLCSSSINRMIKTVAQHAALQSSSDDSQGLDNAKMRKISIAAIAEADKPDAYIL